MTIVAIVIICVLLNCFLVNADQLKLTFSSTDGSSCENISNGYFYYEDGTGYSLDIMTQAFDGGTEITISSVDPMDSIYLEWYYAPDPWILRINDADYPCGQQGYVQEYVKIPEEQGDVYSATIVLGTSRERLIDIYAFSEGELPDFVHVWETPYEEADILFISTHADDEVLFFGGAVPTYVDQGNVRIQVAYFTDFFQSEPYRVQELLDGLWEMGITHYPQLGKFYDNYSESYEEAAGQFDYNECLEYMVETIRRFKPQVVVGQDINNGEYGHGGHMWCSRLIADAIEISADESSFTESVKVYGTWDVLKTYFHLYPSNMLELNARIPLVSFSGRTAIEVANDAYDLHRSQSSWMWFKVSDGQDPELAEYGDKLNCTKFGLYKTLVGDDTPGQNDMLENIVPYDIQQVLNAAENETLTDETIISESETSIDTEVETDSILDSAEAGKEGKSGTAVWIIIIIIVLAVVGLLIAYIHVQNKKQRRRKRKKVS